MPVEVATGVTEAIGNPKGDLRPQNPNAASKKSKESDRRRRRRKQKKNKAASKVANGEDSDNGAQDANGGAEDSSKENSDPQKVLSAYP